MTTLDIALFLKENFQQYYQVKVASNGKEALEKVFEEIPDLVISDVMMPGMDGIELCHPHQKRCAHQPYSCHIAHSPHGQCVQG